MAFVITFCDWRRAAQCPSGESQRTSLQAACRPVHPWREACIPSQPLPRSQQIVDIDAPDFLKRRWKNIISDQHRISNTQPRMNDRLPCITRRVAARSLILTHHHEDLAAKGGFQTCQMKPISFSPRKLELLSRFQCGRFTHHKFRLNGYLLSESFEPLDPL
jgi:hypothetical protein